jgi:hypothetical protein
MQVTNDVGDNILVVFNEDVINIIWIRLYDNRFKIRGYNRAYEINTW